MQIDSDSVLLSFESIKHRKELMISRYGVTPQIAESIFAQVIYFSIPPTSLYQKKKIKDKLEAQLANPKLPTPNSSQPEVVFSPLLSITKYQRVFLNLLHQNARSENPLPMHLDSHSQGLHLNGSNLHLCNLVENPHLLLNAATVPLFLNHHRILLFPKFPVLVLLLNLLLLLKQLEFQ